MLGAWPILKFLFRVVAPTIPEILSTISKMKNQEAEQPSHKQDVEHRIADLDRRLAMQLDLIDTLTTQLAALQLIVRRALTIGIIALALAVIAIAIILVLP
ncbi:MAG: hypothetical protein VST68_13345 [Nitrospirota bacterium]|nr:hypothetical protein [Nitrospirota bacterium]